MNSGKDAEGSSCDLIVVIVLSLAGSAQESQENDQSFQPVSCKYMRSLCIKLSHGHLVLRGVQKCMMLQKIPLTSKENRRFRARSKRQRKQKESPLMKTILTRVSSRFIATSHALLKEIQYLELSVVKSLHDQTLRRNEKSAHFLELVSSMCFEKRRIGFFYNA